MLRQFDQLRGDTVYDAILLVTDEGSYELADDDKTLPFMPAPLWMVHVSGLPKAYDDTTLEAIQQSGGGVATSIEEVVRRMATTAAAGDSVIGVADGYAWHLTMPEQPVSDSTPAMATGKTDGFEALAARYFILGLSQQADMTALANLDMVHRIAKTYAIVSPYSSMIVLVNEAQQKALEEAEAQSDRFDREVETGHEALEKPFNPLHTQNEATIPEADTMILAGLAVLLLGWLGLKKWMSNHRQPH
jgi:putative PEP-CTERM system integral membrane protein